MSAVSDRRAARSRRRIGRRSCPRFRPASPRSSADAASSDFTASHRDASPSESATCMLRESSTKQHERRPLRRHLRVDQFGPQHGDERQQHDRRAAAPASAAQRPRVRLPNRGRSDKSATSTEDDDRQSPADPSPDVVGVRSCGVAVEAIGQQLFDAEHERHGDDQRGKQLAADAALPDADFDLFARAGELDAVFAERGDDRRRSRPA